jgi:hypothetical protein
VSLSLPSVLRSVMGGGTTVVKAVELDQPRLRLLSSRTATANWDITEEAAR